MTASSLSTGSCTERRRIEQRVGWVDGWVGGEESHSRLLCNVFRYSTYVEKSLWSVFCPNFPGNFERARSSGKSRRRGIVVKDWASKQAKREGSVQRCQEKVPGGARGERDAMENMEKLKNMKMPRPGGAGLGLGALLGAAGLGIYTLSNCLFNVEGGHRAIVFNRLMGIKEDVSSRDQNESAHRLRACPLWGALATRSPATNGVVPSRDPEMRS